MTLRRRIGAGSLRVTSATAAAVAAMMIIAACSSSSSAETDDVQNIAHLAEIERLA